MRKIITFDLDGVIFPLVQYICARHGIDFQKVTCHNINHCDLLTREEQLTIIGEFGKRETYEHCGLSAGAEKLGTIAKLADVYVNSWCLGEDEGIKREILHNLAPDIPDDNMVFSTPFKKKTFVHSDYIVEDNLDNIISGLDSAEHFFLIDTPYNQGELPAKTVRVKTLDECMDLLLEKIINNS